MTSRTTDNLEEIFQYLDDLRESGKTNMWGASPFLERNLGMSDRDARKVLGQWMETFDRDKTPAERAAIAKATGEESNGSSK